MKITLLSTALFLAAASASGQTIRAKVDLEGRFIPVESTEPAGGAAAPEAEKPKPRVRSLIGAQRAAAVNAAEAERRLAQAQLERQQGMEPLPSELVPGAPGQLSYRYWKRQEKLRLAVEQAQRRWNKTHPQQVSRR